MRLPLWYNSVYHCTGGAVILAIHTLGKKWIYAWIAALLLAILGGASLAEEAAPEAAQAEEAPLLDGQADAVRTAQRRLIELGHLSGGADGAYGPKTEAALRAYQAENGLEQTGHLDQATFDALTHVDPNAAGVKEVQQRLIDLGYLNGTADGIIGPRSVEALTLFQRLNGLDASGKADADTLERLFSAEAASVPASLSVGSEGEAVEKLQRRLAQLGFFDGDIDGDYGRTTTNAVREFQQHLIDQGLDKGITADGAASALTQYMLYDDNYSSYLRDVMPGEADGEALRIERRLNQLGYMDQPADDVLDDYAMDALTQFGQDADVLLFGSADQALMDALFSDAAPEADYCVPHDIAVGDSGEVVRDVERSLMYGGMLMRQPTGSYDENLAGAIERLYKYLLTKDDPNAELFADARTLTREAVVALQSGLLGSRFGDTDSDTEIMRAQCRLYTLFYLPKVGVDGKFGGESRAALKEFQSVNGLEETGKANEETLDLLFSEDAEAKPFPYRVEVSIARQVVEIYERQDNGDYELVNSFTCSTGLHNSTPRGIFLDGFPVNRWHHFEKFNCWAQYSFEITGDIMFHSVIYSSNNENSLRSGSLYALGNPASHGCIRLKVPDAKWLFEHCKRGSLVIIIY